MPKINFPNVPIAEGVPNLARSANSVAQRTGNTGKVMGLSGGLAGTFLGQYLNAMLAPTYAILDRNGKKLIVPDGPGEFDMKGEANVSTYPIEDGGFQSYNKVVTPQDLSLSLLCSGQGPMSREDFLTKCQDLYQGTDIVTIVTPNQTFKSTVCTSMSYKKTARNGATLLTVNLTFKEIRPTASMSFPNAKRDSSQPTLEGGQTSTEKVDTGNVVSGSQSPSGASSSDSWLDTLTQGYDQLSKLDVDVQRFFGKLGLG